MEYKQNLQKNKGLVSKVKILNAFRDISEKELLFFSCKILEGTVSATSVPVSISFNDKEIVLKIHDIESVSNGSSFTIRVEIIKQNIKVRELYGKEVLVTLLTESNLSHPRHRKNN